MARLIIKTKEQANEYLKSKNKNNIICDRYAGNMKDISSFHCNIDNYEWETNLYNVGNRSGCPCCSSLARVRTIEEVNKWLGENNKTIICTYYDGTVSSRKSKFQCLIDKHEWNTSFNDVKNGKGCPMCARINIGNTLRKTHEEFVEEMSVKNPNIEILGRYASTHEHIECRCKIDGYKWNGMPSNLLRGKGCPVCAGKAVDVYTNSLGYLRPDLLKYILNTEDAYKYTEHSGKRIKCKCPICGFEKNVVVDSLSKHGFSCDRCGDGISYPNKYFRAFIEQTNAQNIQYEWQPKWAKPYKYDIYFIYENIEYIIEVDGGFHIKDTNFSSVQKVKETDKIKDELANNHNITMIRINAYESNSDYLSEQILKSELSRIFNLNNIDWNLCEVNAEKNLLFEVCKYYDKLNDKIIEVVVSKFKINRNTITRYLKLGTKIGLCDYTPKNSIELALERRRKAVIAFDGDNKIGEYCSLEECARQLSIKYNKPFNSAPMGASIKQNKTYKGFTFKYAS